MTQEAPYAIELRNVTKTFGSVVANDKVDLTLRRGEILALLGENGSGKTTLMNLLSGIYYPDSGEMFVDGEPVAIRSPKDAFALGIGMIHQHVRLVDVLTAAENIVLGLPGGVCIDRKALNAKITELSEKYGFELDPEKKIYNMSISEKQTVEILKVLYRGADILILDEPTAVLTPQEAEKLFAILRRMKADGKAIIIITHKLNEVLEISDRVAILRKGQSVGTVNTAEATMKSLTEAMVGRTVSLQIDRAPCGSLEERLRIEHLTCRNAMGLKALDDVSFSIRAGEILGVAGIAGSGQKALCEALTGLYPVEEGHVYYNDSKKTQDIVGLDPVSIARKGIRSAFVPEDRLGMGLVGGLDMVDNMMLKNYRRHKGPFVDRKAPKKTADLLIERLGIVTPGTSTPVRRLSGGNVQKVLLGREIISGPTVLIAAYAVRGLDINSSYTVYELLNEQKKKGVAVLYVGEDLDVLLELCDRVMVLCGGKVSGVVDARTATKEELGMMMVHTGEAVREAKKSDEEAVDAEQSEASEQESEEKGAKA